MMKVGLVNLYGNSVLSISSENGDRDMCCKALLITSLPEARGVTRSLRLWNTRCFGGGPLDLSLCGGDSFLLCLQRGGEIVLSLWGGECLFSRTLCDREATLSLWGGDCLLSLSLSLCRSPMLCSSLHEWLSVGLGPLRQRSSLSLLACYYRPIPAVLTYPSLYPYWIEMVPWCWWLTFHPTSGIQVPYFGLVKVVLNSPCEL